MIHPRLFELQIQHEKEEQERRLRKRMALHEASAAVPAQPAQRQIGLGKWWQPVQDRLRPYWRTAAQTPLSVRKLVQQNVNVSEQR
ncbi:MAG: hypothetical protein DCC55_25230 [Chloroflexi bacterium]|nr:MAG: hypothetical protein DCC55_25230 [Chloroflexota bacterium]